MTNFNMDDGFDRFFNEYGDTQDDFDDFDDFDDSDTKWIEEHRSSHVSKYRYLRNQGVLQIAFNNTSYINTQGERVYQYDVGESEYNEFKNALSKGGYVRDHLYDMGVEITGEV